MSAALTVLQAPLTKLLARNTLSAKDFAWSSCMLVCLLL
jgi:hypothetical protein